MRGKLERASAIRMLDNFGIQVKGGQTKGALPERCLRGTGGFSESEFNVTDIGGQKSACIDHHRYITSASMPIGIRKSREPVQRSLRPILWKMESYRSRMLPRHLPMRSRWILRILPGNDTKDTDMFAYLFRYADWDLVQNMYADTLELADLSAYEAAIQSIEIYDRVGFAFIPFECQPALIAMISDFYESIGWRGCCHCLCKTGGWNPFCGTQ